MKKIVIILCALLTLQCISIHADNDESKKFASIDFSQVDNLMIVAHPDDETIWGGSHLLQGKYLVVCLTNGDNKVRKEEFNAVIKETNSKGIILSYPDKTKGKRDNWKYCNKLINKDIEYLIKKKEWKRIITHNPKGEYGHAHHKMTSKIVSRVVKKQKQMDKFYYFGKYQKKKNESRLKGPMSEDKRLKKQKLLDLYPSQKKVEENLSHMMPYENWIAYNQWK